MNMIRDRKKRWLLAVLLGMLLTMAVSGAYREPGKGAAGFYGMLYPRFCFSQMPSENGQGEYLTPKLTFRWLHGF